MNKKEDPCYIEGACGDADDADHARIDEFVYRCEAPVKFVEINMEFPMGECGPADPREVTSQWPGDMTRH